MKIVTKDAVYIQKEDIMYLEEYYENYYTKGDIPKFIRSFRLGIFTLNDENRYDFVAFKSKKAMKFIKEIHWIVDYADIKDLLVQEIIDTGNQIWEERCKISDKFNAMSQEEKLENMDMIPKCALLDYEVYSLRNIVQLKEGKLKMKLPRGVEYPKELSRLNRIKKMVKSKLANYETTKIATW